MDIFCFISHQKENGKKSREHNIPKETSSDFSRLCKAVEEQLGFPLSNPKDFVFLSECIGERLHQRVGVNTLKRIWGRLDDHVTPRRSTLNILAQFVGADSWETFCQQSTPDEAANSSESGEVEDVALPADVAKKKSEAVRRIPKWVFLLLAVVVAAAFFGWKRYSAYTERIELLEDSLNQVGEKQYQLRRGRRFKSYDDYLKLFGLIDVREYPYFQIHPLHPHVVLWGPEYHNPSWHNDGDAARMMPTITERWEPANASPELVNLRNSELYYNGRRNRDIRLTFMKGLEGDSAFVFLGVYRFSLERSDTTHIVWERVADEANLLHLEALEQFRE